MNNEDKNENIMLYYLAPLCEARINPDGKTCTTVNVIRNTNQFKFKTIISDKGKKIYILNGPAK